MKKLTLLTFLKLLFKAKLFNGFLIIIYMKNKQGKKSKEETVFIMPNGERVNRRQFCDYFEKKIIRTVRKFNMFRIKDTISVIIDSRNSIALLYALNKLARSRALSLYAVLAELSEKEKKEAKKFCKERQIQLLKKAKGKIATAESVDEIAEMIIEEQFNKKMNLKKALPVYDSGKIRPLSLLSNREIELFVKLKGFPALKKKKTGRVLEIINTLEKKHPEIKHAIVNSFLQVMDLV